MLLTTLNMDALHKTRVADNRVCTCWKVHRVEMTNLAFNHLDMNTLKVVNVMKNWIVNGESQTQPGDDLYDLLWISENKKESQYDANKYFTFSRIIDGDTWADVVLLRPVCGYPAYTHFDTARLDMSSLNIVFIDCHREIVVRASVHMFSVPEV